MVLQSERGIRDNTLVRESGFIGEEVLPMEDIRPNRPEAFLGQFLDKGFLATRGFPDNAIFGEVRD